MILKLRFSPCPNDCFIFDAMVHNRIDTEGLQFEMQLEDVETLNRSAFAGEADITKLSYHAYAYCSDKYVLLNTGSALGRNCGPLLVSKRPITREEVASGKLKIAVPGKYTTANFLFGLAFPEAMQKEEMVFSAIEEAVLSEKVDAGLLIHENRFTYAQRGLKKIIDLGEFWEDMTHLPIPLGGIVVRRDFDEELKQKIERVMRRSVLHAFSSPSDSREFVKEHAQEMDEAVMKKHIDLYVNDYTIDLGKEGRQAVRVLFDKAQLMGVVPEMHPDIFIPNL
jgi:1,4-dihydroxy-6-naphthoate synthase